RRPGDLLPAQADDARAYGHPPDRRVPRRRLPGAVASDEANRLALVHGQRDRAQHVSRASVGVDRGQFEELTAHAVSPVPISVVVTCSFRLISSGVPSARIVPWSMATLRSEWRQTLSLSCSMAT